MGSNSIFSNLTAENTAAEISLLLSADFKRKKTVVMLEGEDDIKAFRFLFDRSVTLIKAYGASTTIDKFLPAEFPHEPRVIGIRDRDYQTEKLFERIFYCDGCCCETMLAGDDETFARVVVNFYRGKMPPLKLRYEILRSLFPISAIRLCSERYKWALKVSGTDLSRVIRPGKATTRAAAVSFVNAYNRKNEIKGERLKKLSFIRDTGKTEDYLMITNGHDLVAAMRIYFDHASGDHRSVGDKTLASALRCSYSREAFRSTDLYRALNTYAAAHGLTITAE